MGCTGSEEQVYEGNGLVITNFTSTFNTLRVNEATNLKLVMLNNGDFEAWNITSILYGEGLMTRENENNFTYSILSDKQELQFWTLRVPLKLSQTESTSYTISSRMYYYYNFSGFQQIGFVAPTYVGADLPLSSSTSKSPLKVSIQSRNPIRTLPDEESLFSITITIINIGEGSINYIDCIGNPNCRKKSYINDLRISVPATWTPVTDLSAWSNEVSGDDIVYSINFGELDDNYYEVLNCDETSYDETPACYPLSEALNSLRMVRDEEARIVLQFQIDEVTETLIDSVKVNGNFGYNVDVSDFKNPITLLVLGD
jgi:hypothetical protein